jgi:hypothetical protein
MTLFAYLTENLTSFSVACIFFHVVTNLGISKIMRIISCIEEDKNAKYNLCYYKFNELETMIDTLEEKVNRLTEYNTNLEEKNKEFSVKLRHMVGLNNSNEQSAEAHELQSPILDEPDLNQSLDEDAPCFKTPFLQSQDVYLEEDTSLHANALLDENTGLKQINTTLDKDYEHVTDKPPLNTRSDATNVTSYSYWSVFA